MPNMLDKIKEFMGFLQEHKVEIERALTTDTLIQKIYRKIDKLEGFDYCYIMELMHEETRSYVVFSSMGKLYKTYFRVSGNEVDIESPVEVMVDYPEVTSRISVFRSADSKLKFIAHAGTAVLNKDGEIDTTSLFDSLEENFDNDAYLTFRHLGNSLRFGDIQGVFRIGHVFHAYGEIDETHFLGKVAEERFSEGGWGLSIAFKPETEPELLDFGDVQIRAYTSGKLKEISVLREKEACHYFTNIVSIGDVNRMGISRDQAKKKLLEFAGEGASDLIEKALDETELRERKIEEEGLIARSADEKQEDALVEDEKVEDKKEEQEKIDIQVGDDLVDLIVAKVEEKLAQRFSDIFAKLETVESVATKARELVEKEVSRVKEEMKDVRRTDEEKIEDIINDRPAGTQIRIGYRPTHKNNEEGEKQEEKINYREIAKRTLEESVAKGK